LGAWIAAGVGTAALVACGHAAWLWVSADEARLREIALVQMLRRALEEGGWPTAGVLPAPFHSAFDLATPWSAVSFAAQAVIASSAIAAALALALSPAPLAAVALSRRLCASAVARWCAGVAPPLAATALFLAPGVWVWTAESVDATLYEAGVARQMLLYAVVAWLALAAGFGRGASARRLTRLHTRLGLVLVPAAILAAPLAARGSRHPLEKPIPRAGAPNVLLVSIDSLRADHLGCYGYHRDTTPRLDALAREGVRFERVVAPSPWTLPSHVTMLTGLPPERHGVVEDGMRAASETVFLAETLRAHGYETAGFAAGPYLDAAFGFAQGFDRYDDYTLAPASLRGSHRGSTSAESVSLVLEWLDGRARSPGTRPFFVFLHMWDVHYDYTPPAPFERLFDPGYAGRIDPRDFETGAHIHANMDAADLAHIVALYDGEIAFVDHHLGRLLDTLRARGVLDDTVVVVTADHGEEFFEHGRKGHQKALYDESLLVPLLVRYPRRLPAGAVVRDQVRLMDVPRTILGLAGIDPGADFGVSPSAFLSSVDLTPLARGEGGGTGAPPAVSELFGRVVSIRTATAKWISRGGELYDLLSDPAEHDNLAGTRPGLEGRLRDEARRWVEGWRSAPPLAEPGRVDRDVGARLRALGYTR
jgi:arylsulfatase A-like enzyme